MGPDQVRRFSDVSGTEGVHPPGMIGVRLAGVDRGPRGGMQHQVRSQLGDSRQNGVAVADLYLGTRCGCDVVTISCRC